MPSIHRHRLAFLIAFAIFMVGPLGLAASIEKQWYLEGYQTTGTVGDLQPMKRLSGTVLISPMQLQFSTNQGQFTRAVKFVDKGAFHDYIKNDTKLVNEITFTARSTKARISIIDADTLLLVYGQIVYNERSLTHNEGKITSFEWISVVLTSAPLPIRTSPPLEIPYWAGRYEGVGLAAEVAVGSGGVKHSTSMGNEVYDIINGDNGYYLDDDEAIRLYTKDNPSVLGVNNKDSKRALDYSEYFVWGKLEVYQLLGRDEIECLNLGDGRIFTAISYSRLDEVLHYELNGGIPTFSRKEIGKSEVHCTLLNQQAVGHATLVTGNVEFVRNGKSVPVRVGDPIYIGDIAKTPAKSFVKLVFIDKSQMNVGPKSEMKIEQFSREDSGIIDLIKGYIRSEVTKDYMQMQNRNKTKLFIKTQNVVMGVRGTEFEISYTVADGVGTTTIQMFEGVVDTVNYVTGKLTELRDQQSQTIQAPVTFKRPGNVPEIMLSDAAGNSLSDGKAKVGFGRVLLTKGSKRTLAIRNIGLSALTDVVPVLVGAQAGDFQVVSPPATVIEAGETVTMTIAFKPTAPELRRAVLKLASNDGDENPFAITLNGQGMVEGPNLIIEQPESRTLASGASKIAFGTAVVGGTGTAKTFVIRNTGTLGLTGIGLSLSGPQAGDFILTKPTMDKLAPGATLKFKVAFRPKAKGDRAAILNVLSNDPDGSPFKVSLMGTGG